MTSGAGYLSSLQPSTSSWQLSHHAAHVTKQVRTQFSKPSRCEFWFVAN